MMKFSKMAANYFEDVEIIELHHDQKLDAPSGTALKTAEMIQKSVKKSSKDIRMKKKFSQEQEERSKTVFACTASVFRD